MASIAERWVHRNATKKFISLYGDNININVSWFAGMNSLGGIQVFSDGSASGSYNGGSITLRFENINGEYPYLTIPQIEFIRVTIKSIPKGVKVILSQPDEDTLQILSLIQAYLNNRS